MKIKPMSSNLNGILNSIGTQTIKGFNNSPRAEIEILKEDCTKELWKQITKNIETDSRGDFVVLTFNTSPYISERTLKESTLLCCFTLKLSAKKDCLFGSVADWSWHAQRAVDFIADNSILQDE
tara:strand:- start:444 stop:815 length:372 start_codon:yes stop_codon:yes gene_type:complete